MGAPRQPGKPPTGGPPPGDQQPSAQVAMAAWMLRHGHHPTRVAAVTDVPLALVQLIADNLTPDTGHQRRPFPRKTDPPWPDHNNQRRPFPRKTDPPWPDHNNQRQTTQDPTDHRWDAIAGTHTAQLRRRRRLRVLQSAVICAAVNAAITAVAVQTHQGAVTVACLVLAPLIYTAVLLLLVLPPRPRGPEPHRR